MLPTYKRAMEILAIIFIYMHSSFAYSSFAVKVPALDLDAKYTVQGMSVFTTITSSDFEEVNDSLLGEIASQGIKISLTSHAQKLIERTGKQLGIKKRVYKDALIHLFCKVDLAHSATQANPHVISGCPYSIAIYQLMSSPDVIYLSFRKPPNFKENPEFLPIFNLQKEIVDAVYQEYEE